MAIGALGKEYEPGEVVVQQGEKGECMYVVQKGKVEVVREEDGETFVLTELGNGDVFGEMALFDQEVRSATVRAAGRARVLTVDKRTFLKNVHADPSFAYRILQHMSQRIREMDEKLAEARSALHGD